MQPGAAFVIPARDGLGQLQPLRGQRGAVTSSAGASEEALAPSNPTIYVDTMQPHILKGYNATVHDPQCGVDASCQEGNPPSPELTFLSLGSMLERDLSFTSPWEVYCIKRWFFA